VTSKVAKSLLKAKTAKSFLRNLGGPVDLQALASLKWDVDRLVRSDMRVASRLADRVEEIGAISGDPVAELFAKACRARVLDHEGKHAESSRAYEAASRGMRAAGLLKEAAVLQKEHLVPLTHLGHYREALRTAGAARKVLARSDPNELAQLEANVGLIYYRLDKYKKALDHYNRADKIVSASGQSSDRPLEDLGRAYIFMETDQPDKALELLERARKAFERERQTLQANAARFNIGYIQFRRGNFDQALAAYYKARDRLGDLGNKELVAWCNQDIAEILLALNAFEDSAEHAARARADFKGLRLPYESSQSAMIQGLAAMGLGRFDQAKTDLSDAREAFASAGNSVLTAIADSYLAALAIRQDDGPEARRRSASALRVFARNGLETKSAHSQLLGARAAYIEGLGTKALRMARAALSRVEGLFAPQVVYQCHQVIGKVERDRGRSAPARTSFRNAVAAVETMRGGIAAAEFKSTFLQDKIEVYEDAITACLAEGSLESVEEAFRLVESSKSRALADLLARFARSKGRSAGKKKAGGAAESTRTRLRKLIEDLNWYGSQASFEDEKGERRAPSVAERYRSKLSSCERQVAHLFRRLEAEQGADAAAPATVNDLSRLLRPDETAIEYFITADDISAFVVSASSQRIARNFASRKKIEGILAGLKFQMDRFAVGQELVRERINHLKDAADKYLTELYEHLIEPLEFLIATNKLVIIPHGPLHYVPFHALNDGRSYLVDWCEVSHAPSAAVLKLCRGLSDDRRKSRRTRSVENGGGAGSMVAMGLAEPDTPSVDDEIRALGEIFPGAITLTGSRASYKNLMRFGGRARFLHIASHGSFRPDNPMFSFLKLSDANLNFYSLVDLKLKAELVTLSACQTGVHAIFPGDELHGLMRGFLHAGAPSVVVSLWRASDRATAGLMGQMYGSIRAGLTKRAALRSAHLKVKEEYPHPYYWAPFVLMGNPT
jgi:CHAT domain-containing protein